MDGGERGRGNGWESGGRGREGRRRRFRRSGKKAENVRGERT